MSSQNVSETFGFVSDVKEAEKLLHEHELETTTSYVMYYNKNVGKGKSMSSMHIRSECINALRDLVNF